jgi:preprotein translocase subunit SecE
VKRPRRFLKNNMFGKLFTFLKEVKLEVKKVNWPTRQQTIRYTLIVLGISFGVALLLGAFDFLFTTLLEEFIIK